jgi:glutaredoxin
MKDLNVIVYTMKGCPHCIDFKKMLEENKIEYIDRDIDEFKEEYDIFSEVIKNDMIPALLIIEDSNKNPKSYLYAPDRDYMELTEALDIIQKHVKTAGIV